MTVVPRSQRLHEVPVFFKIYGIPKNRVNRFIGNTFPSPPRLDCNPHRPGLFKDPVGHGMPSRGIGPSRMKSNDGKHDLLLRLRPWLYDPVELFPSIVSLLRFEMGPVHSKIHAVKELEIDIGRWRFHMLGIGHSLENSPTKGHSPFFLVALDRWRPLFRGFRGGVGVSGANQSRCADNDDKKKADESLFHW